MRSSTSRRERRRQHHGDEPFTAPDRSRGCVANPSAVSAFAGRRNGRRRPACRQPPWPLLGQQQSIETFLPLPIFVLFPGGAANRCLVFGLWTPTGA